MLLLSKDCKQLTMIQKSIENMKVWDGSLDSSSHARKCDPMSSSMHRRLLAVKLQSEVSSRGDLPKEGWPEGKRSSVLLRLYEEGWISWLCILLSAV